jgi:acetyl-CoA synthetase
MSSVPVSAANLAAANLAANQAAANANLDIESTLRENRVFPPPAEFAAKAHIKSLEEYEALYKKSIDDPEAFWAGAADELHWFKRWDKVLDWNLPWA